jgi:hypothetical protein
MRNVSDGSHRRRHSHFRLCLSICACRLIYAFMWQFLYFFPEPHGHGSLRPTFCPLLRMGSVTLTSCPVLPWADCWARAVSACDFRRGAWFVGGGSDVPDGFLECFGLFHAGRRFPRPCRPLFPTSP